MAGGHWTAKGRMMQQRLLVVVLLGLVCSVSTQQEVGDVGETPAEPVKHLGSEAAPQEPEIPQDGGVDPTPPREAGVPPSLGGAKNATRPECRDQNVDCAEWATRGQCRTNPHYMVRQCQLACNSCPENHQLCSDNFPQNCSAWASFGECRNNEPWMKDNCFRSCGYCRDETNSPHRLPTSSSTDTKQVDGKLGSTKQSEGDIITITTTLEPKVSSTTPIAVGGEGPVADKSGLTKTTMFQEEQGTSTTTTVISTTTTTTTVASTRIPAVTRARTITPVPSTPFPVPSTPIPVFSTPTSVADTATPFPITLTPVPSTLVPDTQSPMPVSSTPGPTASLPPPVSTTPTAVDSTLIPVPSTPVPVPDTPIPVPSEPIPVPSTPMPVASSPKAASMTPTSVQSTPIPLPSTPIPVPSIPIPVPSTPIPVRGTLIPVPSIPVPIPSTPTPVVSSSTPVSTNLTSVESTPIPVPSIPVPVPSTPIPVTGTLIPVPSVPVPIPSTPAPVSTNLTSVENTPIPVPSTLIPVPTIPIPLPSTPIPVSITPIPKENATTEATATPITASTTTVASTTKPSSTITMASTTKKPSMTTQTPSTTTTTPPSTTSPTTASSTLTEPSTTMVILSTTTLSTTTPTTVASTTEPSTSTTPNTTTSTTVASTTTASMTKPTVTTIKTARPSTTIPPGTKTTPSTTAPTTIPSITKVLSTTTPASTTTPPSITLSSTQSTESSSSPSMATAPVSVVMQNTTTVLSSSSTPADITTSTTTTSVSPSSSTTTTPLSSSTLARTPTPGTKEDLTANATVEARTSATRSTELPVIKKETTLTSKSALSTTTTISTAQSTLMAGTSTTATSTGRTTTSTLAIESSTKLTGSVKGLNATTVTTMPTLETTFKVLPSSTINATAISTAKIETLTAQPETPSATSQKTTDFLETKTSPKSTTPRNESKIVSDGTIGTISIISPNSSTTTPVSVIPSNTQISTKADNITVITTYLLTASANISQTRLTPTKVPATAEDTISTKASTTMVPQPSAKSSTMGASTGGLSSTPGITRNLLLTVSETKITNTGKQPTQSSSTSPEANITEVGSSKMPHSTVQTMKNITTEKMSSAPTEMTPIPSSTSSSTLQLNTTIQITARPTVIATNMTTSSQWPLRTKSTTERTTWKVLNTTTAKVSTSEDTKSTTQPMPSPSTSKASALPDKTNTTSAASSNATIMELTTVTSLTSLAPVNCSNKWGDDQCGIWFLIGECVDNPGWMKLNCYKACGYCVEKLECIDDPRYSDCPQWATEGECESNVHWMTTHCQKSCSKCDFVTVAPSTRDTSPSISYKVGQNTTTVSTTSTVKLATTSVVSNKSIEPTQSPGIQVNTTTDILFTNETHILRYNGQIVTVIVAQEKGSIVGLAVDVASGFIFWSDLSWSRRGIYRATLDGRNQTRIISNDILEVNGLTVDYVSRHIYWTDGVRRRLEMADYDGGNRREVVTGGLQAPRGVVTDPLRGYLFWGDQGTRSITRSLLDGSERTVIVQDNLVWPNQLAIFNSQILFVDGWNKTLTSVNVDGGNRKVVAHLAHLADDNPTFGLGVVNEVAFVTSWGAGSLIKVPLVVGGGAPSRVLSDLGREVMFSVASTDPYNQPEGLNPCGLPAKGGCSHLCLPTGVLTYRCTCPSRGGKVPRNNTCVFPGAILLYADADLGQVVFTDPENPKDKYVVGTSSRPVAVGYDPVNQMVFWSDVQERSVYSAFLNGSGQFVLLNSSQGLGFVDGLFVDWVHRKLYLTNADFVTVDGTAFTWHRVEVVGLDGTGRRSIVTDVEQPRGLWVDMDAGFIYFTDWGQTAHVVRARLDGTQQEVLLDGLENPNDVIVTKDAIYVIDSHAKSREAGREEVTGALYQRNRESTEWTRISDVTLHTPYGLANAGNKLFISDWGRNAILSYDVTTGITTAVDSDVNEPMGVFYTTVSVTPPADDACNAAKCPDVCLTSPTGSAQCACSTYESNVMTTFGGCVEPENFVLVADLNEIRLVSQSPMDGHVYTVVRGNRYTASFSALVWDSWRSKFYFSDVNRRVIYQSDLSGRYSLLYNANDVVDSLIVEPSSSALYWTAQNEGALYMLDLDNPGRNATRISQGLSQPKAMVFSPETSEIYWTEVGKMGTVKRISGGKGPSVSTTVWESAGARPQNLFLDTKRSSIGFTVNGTIYTCSILGDDCMKTASLPPATGVAPSVSLAGDYIYYSDWARGAIMRSSTRDNSSAVPVISGLMRPTDFVVIARNLNNDMCGSGHMCSDLCVSLPLDYACACTTGRLLLADGRRCSDLIVPGSSSTPTPTTRLTYSTTSPQSTASKTTATSPNTTHTVTTSTPAMVESTTKPPSQSTTIGPKVSTTTLDQTVWASKTMVVDVPSSVPTAASTAQIPTERKTAATSETVDTVSKASATEQTSSTTTSSTSAERSTKPSILPTTAATSTLSGPIFTGCPRNRTALLDRGGAGVPVWWLEPVAVDRTGSILSNVKVNLRPGAQFGPGLSFVTYTATDSQGKKAECTFFITVTRKEFGCAGLPAPLNGDMVCRTEEFVYTCEVVCRPGYVRNPAVTNVRPACRTTGWGPAFPQDYISFSCLKQTELKQTQPVTITYSGRCQGDSLTEDFKQAFITKLTWRFRAAGLCPLVPEADGVGLCNPTSFLLQCDTGVGLRKRRQVERIRVNVTISAPANDPDGSHAQRLRDARANLERLLVLERLNVDLDGQRYIAQQVAPLQQGRVGCPPGQTVSDKACVLCPAGSSMVSRVCISCPGGSYQPRPAAYDCFQCPLGTTSPKGAFSLTQCVSMTTAIPTPASSTSANSLSVPIVIGLCVAAGIVFFITLVLAVCTVRRLFRSKGQMTLDQEKAVLNGTSNGNGVRYANPAFVARPREETAGSNDPTPRYVAITKVPVGSDTMTMQKPIGVPVGGLPPGVPQQPIQYRRLPNGQVVRVVTMAASSPTGNGTSTKVRMPPVKSRKYDMKHPAARATPTVTLARNPDEQVSAHGMYRKYAPVSGWQGMSEQDKLNQ